MQIVELDGVRVLEVSENSVFRVRLPEILSPDFTLEFDINVPTNNMIARAHFEPLLTSYGAYEPHYLYQRGNAVPSIQDTSLVGNMTSNSVRV